MMAYANPIDPSTPADGNYLREGDDRIRELKAAIRERLETIFVSLDADPLAFQAGIIPQAALAALLVDTLNIVDLAITTAKLADGAVTDAKITSVDGSKINDNSIPGTKHEDLSINQSKIVDFTIADGKMADHTLQNRSFGDSQIDNRCVVDDTLTGSKLAPAFRAMLVRCAVVDYALGAFAVATDTAVDSAPTLVSGVSTDDIVIVTPDGGDAVLFTVAQKLVSFYGFVNTAGSVTIRFINDSGGPVNMPAVTWRIMVLRRYSDWYP